MTIAIALKVGDGLVLGADSAGTLADTTGVSKVYFNTEKIVNLMKGEPIGMLTYGLGGLQGRSVTALARDLRALFTSNDDVWRLNPSSYTMADVASRVRRFFYDELYRAEYPRTTVGDSGESTPYYATMGFLVAGFSANEPRSEVWTIEIGSDGLCTGPTVLFDRAASGVVEAKGQPEAIFRLLRGWSFRVLEGLVQSGIPRDDAAQFLKKLPVDPLVHPAMPIQDAIDLVYFLADVTASFVRFAPGAPTVAPPIDIAAVTRHEKFRWVRRKHYYPSNLNSEPSARV